MAKTTYTTWLIRLQSWCIVQGARYPDYLNPFMPDQNRYKNVIMPFWFDYLGINRVEAILYNDDISRTSSIVFTISINRSGADIVLYTATIASGATSYISTTAKTLQKNDRLFITITSAPNNNQSAMEVFFNYSNKETAGQFANNISIWFDQFIPKIPVWVIKEKVGDRDNSPLCLPSYGTNNCWYLLKVSWITLTPQRYDEQRRIQILSSTTDRIQDKLSVNLSCWWSTGIWWTGATAAPSANISALLNIQELWTQYIYIASRWLASNIAGTNDTFRLQKYSLNITTQAMSFVARSTAYRTMKTSRSWWWIFCLRSALTGSFTDKIIAWTMLRQQAGVDSKIWWLTLYSQSCVLSNTFQWIGWTDASLYGVYWPWYVYEEVTVWASTITCIAHVTDTTSASAPYPETIAQMRRYDSTWAIIEQYKLTAWTLNSAVFTNKWVTQYGTFAYAFGEYAPDPVWAPATIRPYIIKYDKDWNYVDEYISYAAEPAEIISLHVWSEYLTFVLKNVSDWKSIICRINLSTSWVDVSKKISWLDIYYAETVSYNKIFIHWYSTTNNWSAYWFIYIPLAWWTQRQPSNNFTISDQVLWTVTHYIFWDYGVWFSRVASATNTYTQTLTSQTLSWWSSTTSSATNIFYSLL